MTLTTISQADYLSMIGMTAAQFTVSLLCRTPHVHAIRLFLIGEAILGGTLAILAKTIEAWTYFHCWITASFLHEAFAAALVAYSINIVRRRALPRRSSVWPLQVAVAISLSLAIYSSSTALQSLASMPYWQLFFSWDYAFWYSVGCMLCFVPLYAWCVSATIPRATLYTLLGIGIYSVAQAGLLELIIAHHSIQRWSHLPDVAHCISLVLWLVAARSTGTPRTPATSEETVSLTSTPNPTEQER